MEPLNPLLLAMLKDAFGHVRISNDGVPFRAVYRPDWFYRKGKLKANVVEFGETYNVSCPFCSDTRKRLSICHQWGMRDARTHDDMLHLVRCYNESCLATREAQKELHAMVYPRGVHGQTMQVPLKPVKAVPPPPVIAMRLPSGCPLSELPKGHPAIQYLRQRHFDPASLERQWKLFCCMANPDQDGNPRPNFYSPRIVVPVYTLSEVLFDEGDRKHKRRLAGWQAREIDEHSVMPKYLTACGTKRNELLYGLPQAIRTEGPIVIVEGVTDVWRLETNAVALFGKTISDAQHKLLLRHVADRPIVVMLDQDAQQESQRVAKVLRAGRPGASVVVARLPRNRKDPGECTHDEAWGAVKRALK